MDASNSPSVAQVEELRQELLAQAEAAAQSSAAPELRLRKRKAEEEIACIRKRQCLPSLTIRDLTATPDHSPFLWPADVCFALVPFLTLRELMHWFMTCKRLYTEDRGSDAVWAHWARSENHISKGTAKQFFRLTPKLLEGLPYQVKSIDKGYFKAKCFLYQAQDIHRQCMQRFATTAKWLQYNQKLLRTKLKKRAQASIQAECDAIERRTNALFTKIDADARQACTQGWVAKASTLLQNQRAEELALSPDARKDKLVQVFKELHAHRRRDSLLCSAYEGGTLQPWKCAHEVACITLAVSALFAVHHIAYSELHYRIPQALWECVFLVWSICGEVQWEAIRDVLVHDMQEQAEMVEIEDDYNEWNDRYRFRW